MRILIVTDTGPRWEQSVQVAHELGRLGHGVVLAAPGGIDFGARWQAAAAGAHIEAPVSPLREPAAIQDWVARVATANGVDVVHVHDASQVPDDAALSAATVLSIHETPFGRAAALDRDVPAAAGPHVEATAQAMERAAMVVVPNPCLLDELGGYGAHIERVVVVPPGVPHVYAPTDRQSQVFAAGDLADAAKGFQLLDEAAAHVPWQVRASGPGKKRAFTTMTVLGDLQRAQLAREFTHAGLFVDPALYEPTGLSAIKAAARGCPVILTDIPGRQEAWGQSAAYVPPGDPLALAEAITEIIHDAEARSELSGLASALAAERSTQNMTADLVGVYAHCAGQTVPASPVA